jgi:hypothetical protein
MSQTGLRAVHTARVHQFEEGIWFFLARVLYIGHSHHQDVIRELRRNKDCAGSELDRRRNRCY